jgi:hypothetical protein
MECNNELLFLQTSMKIALLIFFVAGISFGVCDPTFGQTDAAISYFQPSTHTFEWQLPLYLSGDTAVQYAERIALPGKLGYVDSVQIRIDSLSGDSIEVDLDSAQLIKYDASLSLYILNNSTTYAYGFIYPKQVHVGSFVTVVFPHVLVPKNFFVTVAPNISGSTFTNTFFIAGDSEATRTITTDNEHSGIYTLQYGADYFDSLIKPAGDPGPVFSNFYITAFVDTTTASGAVAQSPAAEVALQSYPNPFTANTTITLGSAIASEHASLVVYDRLGRAVQDLSQAIRNRTSAQFNGANLPTGFYFARYSDGARELTLPMALQK